MQEKIATLQEWINNSKYTVFFGGAGVSTDSGLADFRSSSGGLYNQPSPYDFSPDRILSHEFYLEHREEFFDYYRTKLLNLKAAPNYVHYALKDMEDKGRLQCIITQNADNLHQRAGSKNVIDIHGNVYDNTCESCKKMFPPEVVAYGKGVPHCECGGVIRPGIVLFDEIPDMKNIFAATKELSRAELIIIAGSSMRISSTPALFNGIKKAKSVILNDESTAFDHRASLIINGRLTPIFKELWPMKQV